MLRAAVIGVGTMGEHHARVYGEMESTTLVALADVDESAAARVARRCAVPWYTDYRTMLERERPDLVTVAVPTRLHRTVAMDAIGRGIHVLVEKPIALTEEDGRAMIEAARVQGVTLMVGHIECFNPAIVELRRRLQAAQLGQIFQISARRLGPFPYRIFDAGVVLDLATHDLDIMCRLIDSPVRSLYAATAQRIHSQYEDLLSCILRFENGVVGTLNVNWLTPTKIRELSIIGEQGMFLANYLTQDLVFFENGAKPEGGWEALRILGMAEGPMVRYELGKVEPLKRELAAFADAVAEKTAPPVTGEDGLKALRLALAVLRSGQLGQAVSL